MMFEIKHTHTLTHTHTHTHTLTHTHTHTHTHLYILQTKVVYSLVCLQTKVVYSLVCEPLGWFLKKKPRGAGRGAPTNHARLPQTIGKTFWFVKFQSGQRSSQWFLQTTARKKVPTKNTQTGNKPLWFFFTVRTIWVVPVLISGIISSMGKVHVGDKLQASHV